MKENDEIAGKAMSQAEIRDTILNRLDIAIYVSDLATNEILYVNMALQKQHGDVPLVGGICWEALKNRTKRCDSCPIPYLLKHPGRDYQRELYNSGHHKIYDSIIPWENGKMAHMRYVVDIAKD